MSFQIRSEDIEQRRALRHDEGDDRDDDLWRSPQAIEGGALRGGESLPALGAAIARIFAAMNPDIAFSDVSLSRTVCIRAKCSVRVHAYDLILSSVGAEKEKMNAGLSFVKNHSLHALGESYQSD